MARHHFTLRASQPNLSVLLTQSQKLTLQAALGIIGEPLLGKLTDTSISPAGKQVVLGPVGVVLRPVGKAKTIQLEPAGFCSMQSQRQCSLRY